MSDFLNGFRSKKWGRLILKIPQFSRTLGSTVNWFIYFFDTQRSMIRNWLRFKLNWKFYFALWRGVREICNGFLLIVMTWFSDIWETFLSCFWWKSIDF